MKRQTLNVWFLGMAFVALAVTARPAAAQVSYYFGFDQTLSPFGFDTDVKTSASSFELRTGENGCRDLRGNGYANLKLAPSRTGTSAWMVGALEATGLGMDIVHLTWYAKNTGNCSTCKPIVYAGGTRPLSSKEFADAQLVKGMSLEGGWAMYTHRALVENDGQIYLAIGMRGPQDVTTHAAAPGSASGDAGAYGFDCLSVQFYPVEPR